MGILQTFRRISQIGGWDEPFNMQEAQLPLIKKLYSRNGLELKMTCGACPEQYEVFKEGKQVAYYRLRHGKFRVDYPNVRGKTIYEAEPLGDGIFEPEERLKHLTKAMRKLIIQIQK